MLKNENSRGILIDNWYKIKIKNIQDALIVSALIKTKILEFLNEYDDKDKCFNFSILVTEAENADIDIFEEQREQVYKYYFESIGKIEPDIFISAKGDEDSKALKAITCYLDDLDENPQKIDELLLQDGEKYKNNLNLILDSNGIFQSSEFQNDFQTGKLFISVDVINKVNGLNYIHVIVPVQNNCLAIREYKVTSEKDDAPQLEVNLWHV